MDDKIISSDEPGMVGFGGLPNQIQRTLYKKGFDFTLMVVGQSGLGKSTLINTLFLTDLPPKKKSNQKLKIQSSTVEIEERGVKLRLSVVDTVGFGDSINNEEGFQPIIKYIDDQFEKYLRDESGLNRRNIHDSRVHCLLYFIDPSGHCLKPIDIQFLKEVHNRVNVIPIIPKADMLTINERQMMKKKIRQQLIENKIAIYDLPPCEPDDDESYKKLCKRIKDAVPFAVIASMDKVPIASAAGKGTGLVRGRTYPWGTVLVDDEKHSDFVILKKLIITHLQDLQDVTHTVHYENYRSKKLSNDPKRTLATSASGLSQKERDLLLKEQELEQMKRKLQEEQEMLRKQREGFRAK